MQVMATRATLISTLMLLNKLKPTTRRLKATFICTLHVCYQAKGPLHSSANGVDVKHAPSWSFHKPCSMQKQVDLTLGDKLEAELEVKVHVAEEARDDRGLIYFEGRSCMERIAHIPPLRPEKSSQNTEHTS
ncbi:hypothetical protein VNO77_27315 [Canavalia gladiata]|uniref:Uncharacterized protein n=1 Tax=Canavalia gladiata TaxID=3824 RepID=A0AAN9KTT2_CANGL